MAHLGGKCERCDGVFHENVYDFHHFDHTQKSFPINQATFQRNWDNILAEAEKCKLLCANCHREVHTFNEPEFIAI